MMSICKPVLHALAVLGVLAVSACSSTWVVVPHPASQYSATDTLYGIHRNGEVRVTFRHDTVMRVDTVVRVDTAWVRGSRTLVRVDTVLRVDTVRIPTTRTLARVDTVLRVDTVRIPSTRTLARVDTVLRVDTVRIPTTRTLARVDTVLRVDTIRVPGRTVVRVDTVMRVDTVRAPGQTVVRVDTVMRVDTIRVPGQTVVRVDTLRVVVTDTVVRTIHTPGRRMLFVPPGHYPPEGQCRVWIHDQPPGQQAGATACDALGDIPAGAFVLFGGDAWDFDYDWIAEAQRNPGTVPPQIIGLTRRR